MEREMTEMLCRDLETPNNMDRWRELGGEDPDMDQLGAKRAVIEERLNDTPLVKLKEYVGGTRDTLAIMEKAIREKELAAELDNSCGVCLDAIRDVALNCGHRFCTDCAKALKECPYCRATVTHRITLH